MLEKDNFFAALQKISLEMDGIKLGTYRQKKRKREKEKREREREDGKEVARFLVFGCDILCHGIPTPC